jgi:hypothetical protein
MPGAIDVLADIILETPKPQGRDQLVKINAVSINPVDTKLRRKAQPPAGETRILGLDAAGIVEAVRSEVQPTTVSRWFPRLRYWGWVLLAWCFQPLIPMPIGLILSNKLRPRAALA